MKRLAGRGRLAFALAALLLAGLAPALQAHAADEFLEPEKAFQFSTRSTGDKTLEVRFDIAPGYYMYREQFKFEARGAALGAVALPQGKVKFDDTFQKDVETYRGALRITVPVESAPAEFRFVTTSQGCADAGLCYPPMKSGALASLVGFGGSGIVVPAAAGETRAGTGTAAVAGPAAPRSETTAIESVLSGGSFWPVVGAFFLAGILLSLTPCVLPMLPIVSSIIVGQGGTAVPHAPGAPSAPSAEAAVSRRRGLALAASYSLGMALVYTAFGVAAGLAGKGLAAALQNPWTLGAFALGLVALASSMFGIYELRMPVALSCRFASAAGRMPAGRVAGVAAMGGVSALIVSPCVTAPLAGAMLYLSQTRDVWLGGTALFSLSAGMSMPLLLVGASAGAWLPKTGGWMLEVKALFGILLLGVAVWTIQPVLPGPASLALWGLLALGAAALLVSYGRAKGSANVVGSGAAAAPARPLRRAWRHAIAALLVLIGLLQIVGAAAGGSDPLQPLARFSSTRDAGAGMPMFTRVRNVAELDTALRSAGRPVMLDFYADWCISCKEMERFTFARPEVQQRLAGALLLKADVTAHSAEDRELLRRFRLFGPPGILFFDARGQEIVAARVIGFQRSGRFLETLRAAGL